ncbi:4'-phosphopantetheinyl transferase family protein [Arthrobacter sp. B6]|uniref:4'-phosphopantetheinyl transferase family protein n=1 Tax=Arthrobacter sp. B6 TaxID=1570137 RepID=UPI00082A470D|nr:4'-phosphopantetheinyl transferase superfamily protein [Arthrobacter sp. B6]
MESGLVLQAVDLHGRAADGPDSDALLLEPVEAARAAAMEPGVRARFVAGRAALRRFAGELLELPPGELRVSFACPVCGSGPDLAHGRPAYTRWGEPVPLLLSMARTHHWILLAGLPAPGEGMRLGVDAEDPSRLDFDGFDAVALSPDERRAVGRLSGPGLLRERARLWTRKEAWLKMTGEGLRADPRTVEVLGRSGIADLDPADTGLPDSLVAAVALG